MVTTPFNMTVHVDTREIDAMLNGFLQKIEQPRPLLTRIGKYIQALTMQMFFGRRPDKTPIRGVRWNALAEKTIMAKRAAVKRGAAIIAARPLVRTGKLRDSLAVSGAVKIYPRGLIYGTTLRSRKGFPYPGFHQVGDKRVPARPWLFITRRELFEIAVETRRFLEGTKAKFGTLAGRTKIAENKNINFTRK